MQKRAGRGSKDSTHSLPGDQDKARAVGSLSGNGGLLQIRRQAGFIPSIRAPLILK